MKAAFHFDVHIGIVALIRASDTHPGPCIRVHIWTDDGVRAARWASGKAIAGPYPSGVILGYRRGPAKTRHYLEFAWVNPDVNDFEPHLDRVTKCVDFFVAARAKHRIP